MEKNIMLDKIKKVEEYIERTYKSWAMTLSSETSKGNYDDCFYDGVNYGESLACYNIAAILGIPVEEPEDIEEDE
jgi:hypothetical protein